MFELRIHLEGRELTFPLKQGARWRIGRSDDCEISVPDKRISSDHAELLLTDGKLSIARTKGRSPILIDGKTAERAELSSGSSFIIGHTTFMVVTAQDGMNLIDARTVLAGAWPQSTTRVVPKEPLTSPVAAPPDARLPDSQTPDSQTSMRLLAQIFSLLTKASDRASLANAVLDLACQRLTATRALLARVEDTQGLEIIASRGIGGDADVKSLISTTVLKQIVDERQAVIIGNMEKLSGGMARQESIVRNRIQAVACTPVLSAKGKLAALLYVDNQDRPREFSAQEAELLIWLGQLYSLLDDNLEMRRRLEAEVTALKRGAISGAQLVAESPAMVLLLERVKRAAASEAAVLIQGESGTGKECIARMLHQQSPRKTKPFVARNCAAIPETLFESEMFGHKKGAFTGADSERKGAFLEAHGGTLFLDEIGDLNYGLQTKLLRAIQEKVVRPVGSDRDLAVDARIICATNKDLREACRAREFREDLYYRLATVTLTVAPLRERRDDIIPLARHFVRAASDGTRSITPPAEERLRAYDWPGNVRELRSIVEQAVIFAARNEIQPDELSLPSASGKIDLSSQSLEEVERRHILQVLQQCGGNKTEAARVLGLARSTLVLKLQGYEK